MPAVRLVWLAILVALAGTLGPLATHPAAAAPTADAGSTLVVIDTPRGERAGTQLYVAGWAADPRGASGTGVDRVEVYLDGERDAGGTLLGRATYGLQRPDVAAHLGSTRFAPSGYALQANVEPGPHTVYVYAHTSGAPVEQGWAEPKTAVLVASPGLAGTGAVPPGVAGLATPLVGPSAVTTRLAGITGSYTLGVPTGVGADYPPGPADTGGPIVAPPYFGLGLYGYPLGSAEVFPYGAVVPPGFDWSYGQGYNWVSSDVFYAPYPRYGRNYLSPYSYYRTRFGGPLYCPLYQYCP